MARRRFTAEFKREAVELASQPGQTITSVARDLGIGSNVLVTLPPLGNQLSSDDSV